MAFQGKIGGKGLIACVALAGAAHAQDRTGANGAAGEPQQELIEIVVTASKREERLRDVPSAVTAISSEKLENLGVQSFRDYASLVPGLSQRESGAPGMGTVILRGMNTGSQQLTNTTAYYIDDTPFTATGFVSSGSLVTPEPELAEVERIEVLKGPQGTLYGASSLGGLIRLVTKKPDTGVFSASVRSELSAIDGGGTGHMLRGSLNVPVVQDKLGVQVTGYSRQLPGFTDNVATGTRDVNESELQGGRVAIRATPTERLTIDVSGMLQNIETDGYGFERLVGGSFAPTYARYQYDQYRDFGSQIRYRIASATATLDTDLGSLIASGSYGRFEANTQSDGTSSFLGLVNAIAPGLGYTIPENTGVRTSPSPSMDKYTGEIRFVSKRLGRVEFMAGGFYTHEMAEYKIDIVLQDTLTGQTLPTPLDYLYRTVAGSRYEEVAGYGNLTYYITDNVDVTGGVRYARNDQLATVGGDAAIYAFVPRAKLVFPIDGDATTYLATLRWRPTDRISTYLRAASGYRPGGPQTNANPPPGAPLIITPDSVWNYEAGVKGSFFKDALSANLAVYRIDWKDLQLNTLDPSGVTLQTNAGAAKVDGWELELISRPTDYLTLTASAGHTNARITSIPAGVRTATGANVGDNLPLTPDYTAAFTADQRIPLSDSATGFIGATLRYQSDMPNKYPASTPALQPTTLPSITTADLQFGVDFARYTVQLRVQNLLNEYAVTNVGSDYMATVIPPRRYTLAFSAHF